VARATATAAAAFRGRPVPVAALTSLPSVTVSSTSSARRQAPRGRHQGHQTDVVEAAVGSLQPDRSGGANDPMQSDPLPFPAVRAVGESRRHTACLALSTALPVACLLAAPSLAAAGPMRPSRRRVSRPSFPVVRAVPPSRAWGLPPLASLAAASPTQLSHGRPLWLP